MGGGGGGGGGGGQCHYLHGLSLKMQAFLTHPLVKLVVLQERLLHHTPAEDQRRREGFRREGGLGVWNAMTRRPQSTSYAGDTDTSSAAHRGSGVRFPAPPRPSLAGSRGRGPIGSPLRGKGEGNSAPGCLGVTSAMRFREGEGRVVCGVP